MGREKRQGRERSLPEQSRGKNQKRVMEGSRYNCERGEWWGREKCEVPQIQAHVHHTPTLAPRVSGRGEPGGVRSERKWRAGRNEQHLAQQGGKRRAAQSCRPAQPNERSPR